VRYFLFIVIAIACACAQQAASHASDDGPKLQWTATEIPGLKMAVVSGDPKAEGPFVLRLRADKPVRIPPHSHKADERMTAISGTPAVGEGTQFVGAGMRNLETGESVEFEKGEEHFAALHAGDEVEIHGEGPFENIWVDPRALKALQKERNVDSASERTKMKREQDKP